MFVAVGVGEADHGRLVRDELELVLVELAAMGTDGHRLHARRCRRSLGDDHSPLHRVDVRIAVEDVGAGGGGRQLVVLGGLREPLVPLVEHAGDGQHGHRADEREHHRRSQEAVELPQLGVLRFTEPAGLGEDRGGRDQHAEQQHERTGVILDGGERHQPEEHRQPHQVRSPRPVDGPVGEQEQREHVGDPGEDVDSEVVPHLGEAAQVIADDLERGVGLEVERDGRAHHPDGQQVGGAVALDLDDEERRQRDVDGAEGVVEGHLQTAGRVAGRPSRLERHVRTDAGAPPPLAELLGEAREGRREGGEQAEPEPDDRGRGIRGVGAEEGAPVDAGNPLR